jgi:hypothetical protein
MPETENTIRFRPNGQKIVMHGYDFFNGYQFGYRYYVTTCRHLPILDTGMYEFLMKTMSNVKHSNRWKAGVLVGWIAALLDYEEGQTVQTDPLVTVGNEETPTC